MLSLQSQVANDATVEDMFFFLHGPSNLRGLAAVFFGYIDGSNTHQGAKVWSLCGFLGEPAAFEALDVTWKGILDKPSWPSRLTRFHAYDCVHGYNQFESWSFAERLTLWGELISVITSSHALVALGSVVITEDFEKLESEERGLLRSEALGEPLDLSVQYIFQKSITLTRNTSEEESVGLLFDNENPHTMDRCYDFSKLYKTRFGFDRWLAGIGFGDSAKFRPLQAADLLAYGTYWFISDQRYPQARPSDFPVEPGFLRMIQGILTAGGGFDLESMKDLASEIRKKHAKTGK